MWLRLESRSIKIGGQIGSSLRLIGEGEVGDFGDIWAMVMRRSSGMVMWVVVMVVGLSCAVVESQAPCAGSDPAKLYVCLAAAKADVTPSAACCQALASFNTDAGTACLCAASTDPRFTSSGGKSQFAVLIPQKCNLRYKAGLKCNGVQIPGGQ